MEGHKDKGVKTYEFVSEKFTFIKIMVMYMVSGQSSYLRFFIGNVQGNKFDLILKKEIF